MRRILFLSATIGLVAVSDAGARPKTDIIVLENEDRITCEILQLVRGKLTAKTDRLGTVEIEWNGVVGLQSDYYFRVENQVGTRWFGALSMVEGGLLEIGGEAGVTTVAHHDVVEIREIERSFWSQHDGSLSFGFSFTKASQVAQLTFDWANLWRTERNLVDSRVSTIITDKDREEERTVREDFSLGYTRLLRAKWTGTLNTGFQKNDELSLAGRFLFSAATGATPLKSNLNVLRLNIGLAVNSERATTADTTAVSMEGVLSADYSLFKYETPKSDLSTSLVFYPSLTEEDRYRVDFNLKLRHELIKDLFVDLSYYTNLDSNAPGGEGKKSDYGIVTSVGWSY
jgi:hypothetical protein